MTDARRVVITGIGAVTPIGTGVEGFWDGLRARRSAVATVTRFDPEPFRTRIAAEVRDFRPHSMARLQLAAPVKTVSASPGSTARIPPRR